VKKLKKKMDILVSIIERLGKTNDKKNIMTEAKELFFDDQFLKKVDSNPYIICFKNGVVDFKERKFRQGLPDDYLSKCTNIDYVKIDKQRDAEVLKEIEDFMHKLFPNPQLHEYMWQHLASTLIGTTTNQTFNMYIGIGQNGKSVLINLMEHVLGDYKGDVPLTLITQQRTKIGGVSPEIVQLKGTRYAVIQEPSKGDRINEGIMKQISAGDALTGRAPYMTESITFTPQFKLVVCSNEFMEIKTQDHGTWRRIRVVDFESLFTDHPRNDDPEKPYQFKLDKTIKEKFDKWKCVFASLLVEKVFLTNGMVEDCDKVMASSLAYKNGQDILSAYVHERIMKHQGGCITKGTLAQDFVDWFSVNCGSGKRPSMKDVTATMDKIYGKQVGGVWTGVRFSPMVRSSYNEDDNTTQGTDDDEYGVDLNEL